MAFNLTSLKSNGRDWSRGEPPPPGSFEYVGCGALFDRPTVRTDSDSGFQFLPDGFHVFEIGFTELDAADRWMHALYESIHYTRKVHGDRVLTKGDVADWDSLMSRWVPFRERLTSAVRSPAWIQMWLKENKSEMDGMLHESHRLHDRFAAKGMPMVPIPYMGELVILLRTMPKGMTAKEMRAKLEAGIRCGEKMLDRDTAWWQWRRRDDTHGLTNAITDAGTAAGMFGRSDSTESYGPGSPVYDEFLRRLTRIYIEAAGLYGIVETKRTAVAEAIDEGRKGGKSATDYLLWLLAAVGVGYLGIKWIAKPQPVRITVGVPDAMPTPGGAAR